MKKTMKYITGMFVGLSLPALALAQDFYNGCRGPKAVQMDTYLNHSGGQTSGMVIPKLFTKNLDTSLTDILIAAPFSVSGNGEVENKGINLGYLTESKYGNLIGALGLFKGSEGKYNVLNPQIYFTHMNGPLTFDLEGNLPINLRSLETEGSASATLGYGVNDRLRVGGSITKGKGKDLDYRANARIELTKDHKYWLQGYIGKAHAGARLAINF
ncbi:hypothetical protein CEE44_01255 [Candidatus Woesearchaeota archaeon B3_Woes]|nr:MAG: hypothetical protein CEE44_01255 [Candidatus Woesearchaeota archaeon B3_Woes]